MAELLRLYETPARDGYPAEWWRCPDCNFGDSGCQTCLDGRKIAGLVRTRTSHRCERCLHPYIVGTRYEQPWSPCDRRCRHRGPARLSYIADDGSPVAIEDHQLATEAGVVIGYGKEVQARSRILTVHHLNGDKLDCRWWNLVALCQRCHLTIQGKVRMERRWLGEHSNWFKPYAAAWYALDRLGEDLSREETMARLEELLALEARQLEISA